MVLTCKVKSQLTEPVTAWKLLLTTARPKSQSFTLALFVSTSTFKLLMSRRGPL